MTVPVCDWQIGPRMTLQLVKIEEGMGEGSVLYHAVSKYPTLSLLAVLAHGCA